MDQIAYRERTEQRLASQLGLEADQQLELGPIRAALLGKDLDEFEKGCVRALLTGAIWTRVRLAQNGYLADGQCRLCGCMDTLEHRLSGACGDATKMAREIERQYLRQPLTKATELELRKKVYRTQASTCVPPTNDHTSFVGYIKGRDGLELDAAEHC